MFDDICMEAFTCLKDKLISALMIIALDWSKPFELMCDTSGVALGVVLWQRKDNLFHPKYYASKDLNVPQMNYMVTEQELIALVLAFEKFCSYTY